MTTRKVHVIHNVEAHRFEADIDGFTALAAYHLRPGRIVFTHTEVPYQFRGRGVAGQIVQAGLEYAREQGLSVMPICSYVAEYIRRHPEYQSLITTQG
jgi:predicted GNAT family acetyltransferase